MKEEEQPTQAVDIPPEAIPSLSSDEARNTVGGQATTPPPPHVVLGSDLIGRDVTEIPMLYDDLILAVGIWAIIGASDTCKSMILRQLAMCIAGGREFLGRRYRGKHRSVIIVCTEDDELSISFLLKMQNESIGVSEYDLANVRFIFDTADLLKKLAAELERQPADLVIIDAFGDVFDGKKELNQNNQVRTFLNDYNTIAKKHECSLCFLHHTGKRTEELEPNKNNSIGSQGFEAKMRLVVELRIDASDESLRHFCIVKGNYMPSTAKTSSYVLKMDEKCVFTDTNSRKPFEELVAKKEGGGKAKSQGKTPCEYEAEVHEAFLLDTYKPQNKPFSGRGFTERVMRRFGVSDQKARAFMEFYLERKWLVDKSNSHNRKELHINTFGMKSIF